MRLITNAAGTFLSCLLVMYLAVKQHNGNACARLQLVELFGSVRDKWIADDLHGWLDANGIYASIPNDLAAAQKRDELYIVTTKQVGKALICCGMNSCCTMHAGTGTTRSICFANKFQRWSMLLKSIVCCLKSFANQMCRARWCHVNMEIFMP